MYFLRAIREDTNTDGPMTFVASTAGVKRDGLEIHQDKWRLDNYEANPVVLWAHDYSSPPIGRAEVRIDGDRLMADVTFDPEDDFAQQVRGKYTRGFLNAVSVGWSDIDVDDDVEHELLDISAVPVPGDPDALAERQRTAFIQLRDEIDEAVDSDWTVKTYARGELLWVDHLEEPAEPVEDRWADVAAAMVAVFAPRSDDAEREAEYNALLPKYRRLGKTAPEWMPSDDLAELDADNWRGLFLEGELETLTPWWMDADARAGAVLNARNKADLRKAADLIMGVLKSADKGEPDEDEERAVNTTVTVGGSMIERFWQTINEPDADELELRTYLEALKDE